MVHRTKTVFTVIALILCTVFNSLAQKQSSGIIYLKSAFTGSIAITVDG